MCVPSRATYHPEVAKMRQAVRRIPAALLLSFCWWDRYDDCRAVMEVAGLVEPERRLRKAWRQKAQAGMRRKVALPRRKAKRGRRQRKHPETPHRMRRRILKACRTVVLKRLGREAGKVTV